MGDSVGTTVLRGIERALMWVRPRRLPPVSPPTTITDEEGREMHLRPYREADREPLSAMYEDFESAHRAQGVPPLGTAAIRRWLEGFPAGPNVLALHDGRVVGHASLVPDSSGGHELAIFAHQDYQNAGIGTRLLAAGLDHARDQGVSRVWLTVARPTRAELRRRRRRRRGARACRVSGATLPRCSPPSACPVCGRAGVTRWQSRV